MLAIPILIIPFLICAIWLLSIRPYCLSHREGRTPGATIGVTMWVDWQQAGEIARKKDDAGMIMVCRLVLWLHLACAGILLLAIISDCVTASEEARDAKPPHHSLPANPAH